MMVAKDYRHAAWRKLSGNWGTMILIMIIEGLITSGVAAATFFLGGLGGLIVAGPLTLGVVIASLNVVGSRKAKIEQMFEGFKKNFLSSFLLNILISILVSLWSLLFIIPGIIKTYSYSMSFYVLADNPSMGANDARKRSMEIMNGNKWRLFCLHFSFIGWILLSMLTFGILLLFVVPYMQIAEAEFYRSLVPEHNASNGNKSGDPFGDTHNGGGKFDDASSDSEDYANRTDDAADAIFNEDDNGHGSRTDEAADAIFREDNDDGNDSDDRHNRDYDYEYMDEHKDDNK